MQGSLSSVPTPSGAGANSPEAQKLAGDVSAGERHLQGHYALHVCQVPVSSGHGGCVVLVT
jgi:hypothetical protein